MTANTFTRPVEEYTRDYDLVGGFVNQSSRYLQMQTGAPLDKCEAFVREALDKDGRFELKDRRSLTLVRNKHGDREPKVVGFMQFLKTVEKNNLKLSPALNAYYDESVIESDHSVFIKEGVDARSYFKGEMFTARDMKDWVRFHFMKGEQENKKINNNSYSGATLSNATALFYKSTHPSLTSTCRAATSYANATNEKLLAGNRHYYSPDIVKANILAIIQAANLELLQRAIEAYGLVYPTVENCMETVARSAVFYWESDHQLKLIRAMFTHMTEVERAAFVYSMDLYQLHRLNKEVIETFLFELAGRSEESDGDGVDAEFKSLDGDMELLATFLHFDHTKGRALKDVYKEEPEVIGKINATSRMMKATLLKYKLLIRAVFLCPILPGSIYEFPTARRRVVPISDTDSTMFSMAYWVEALFGRPSMSNEAKRVVFAIVFIITGIVAHLLAMLSASMGVTMSKRRILAMKNEFYFSVLISTTSAKHYCASQDAQEGRMFAEPVLEVKGVGLRDSKVPAEIKAFLKDTMWSLINTVKAEKKINMHSLLTSIGDKEREIEKSLMAGETKYTISKRVKPAESYAKPESSAYYHYKLWQEVFAPKYGNAPDPTYDAVKVSLLAGKRSEIEAWCTKMGDKAMAERLKAFLHKTERTGLSDILLPAILLEQDGIPPEIIAAIDIRNTIFSNMSSFYLLLESFQVMFRNKNHYRLVSDSY